MSKAYFTGKATERRLGLSPYQGFSLCEMPSPDVLDLIVCLNQTDSPAKGVRYTTGPNPHAPALLLDG
ncbi:hypothetical protein ACOMHN_021614 [Nucella lapillus]